MRIRRNLLRGAVSLAFLVPTGLIAALAGPSLMASAAAPAYPVVCQLSATITFNPPLTPTGVVSSNSGATETTTVSGGTLSNCVSADPTAAAPTGGSIATLTITTPATKLIGDKVNKVQQYATGYCPGFVSASTLKALKGLSITVTWTGGQGGTSTFTDKSPGGAVANSGEIGFVFGGKAVTGSYSEKNLNQISAYVDAADSANLLGACSGGTVTTATIDPTRSIVII